MIGLDTSHVVEFTRRLNAPGDKEFIPGNFRVIAFKGGKADIPSKLESRGRIYQDVAGEIRGQNCR